MDKPKDAKLIRVYTAFWVFNPLKNRYNPRATKNREILDSKAIRELKMCQGVMLRHRLARRANFWFLVNS